MRSSAWDWDDAAIVDDAVEKLGEPLVDHLLKDSDDRDIRRFSEGWKLCQMRSPMVTPDSYAERMRSIPASEVIEAAYGAEVGVSYRGWGMHADDGELETLKRSFMFSGVFEKPRSS